MTDQAALLAAILHKPEDNAPRLVYADHLDERGDHARAEFIRVQIGLHAGPDGYPREIDVPEAGRLRWRGRVLWLAKRERDLWAAHWPVWGLEVPGPWTPHGVDGTAVLLSAPDNSTTARVEFRRGFVASIRLDTAAFLAAAAGLFRGQPVTEVRLTDKRPRAITSFDPEHPLFRWDMDHDDPLLRDAPGRVPMCLWNLMSGGGSEFGYDYATEREALNDLGQAAVAYGRSVAAGHSHEVQCGACEGRGFLWESMAHKFRCLACSGFGRARAAGLPPL